VRVRCIPMVESSSDLPRIPENIRSAFRDAVGLFCNWWGPAPEPLVSVDQRHFTISAVCGFVMKFDDVMPEYLQQALWDLRGGNRGCPSHPERCVIAHPFNPPHLVPLVERAAQRLRNRRLRALPNSSRAWANKQSAFAKRYLGTSPIVCRRRSVAGRRDQASFRS
jgi:hypothetical protein